MPNASIARLVHPRALRILAVAALVALLMAGPGIASHGHAQEVPTIDPDSGLAARQFTWLLARINDGGDLRAEEIDDHFTQRFVAAVGTDAIIAQLHEAATTYAPIDLVAVIQQTDDLVHVQARDRTGRLLVIAVSIEHSDEKIAGFIFQPGEADEPFATPFASPVASPAGSPAASPAAT